MWKRAILWSVIGILACQLAHGQYVQNALPTPPPDGGMAMPLWGVNQRLSHTSLLNGPTQPQVRWIVPGGAINEPIQLGSDSLVAPQMTAFGTVRYPYYAFFNSLNGQSLGTVGPFWGQLSSFTIFNTAIYVFGDNDVLLQVVPEWPVYIFSGGQYDVRIFSPSPVFGVPDLDTTLRGLPAYRSGYGVYTDGLMGNAVLGDHFGNLFAVSVYWVLSNRYNGAYLGIDFSFTPFPPIPSAVLSTAVFNEHNDFGFASYHNGIVLVYDTYSIPQPGIAGGFSISDLSAFPPEDRVDPNDPNSDLDPIVSDSVDRPIVFSRDNTIAFICASNYGRIYAVDILNPLAPKVWYRKLDNTRRIPIMAGPSLGVDANGDEVIYVIGRTHTNRSTLYAIDARTGAINWSIALPNVSRCTPTVDASGRLYFGDERGFLYCYNPNGTLLWRLYFGAAINVSPSLMLSPDGPDPGGAPDEILVVAVSNRYLIALQQFVPPSPVGGAIGAGTIGGGAQ